MHADVDETTRELVHDHKQPAHPVRREGPGRADPEASGNARPERVRVRVTGGEFQDSFKTAWESLVLVANGHDTKRVTPGSQVD